MFMYTMMVLTISVMVGGFHYQMFVCVTITVYISASLSILSSTVTHDSAASRTLYRSSSVGVSKLIAQKLFMDDQKTLLHRRCTEVPKRVGKPAR